jgi:hypothetical protein
MYWWCVIFVKQLGVLACAPAIVVSAALWLFVSIGPALLCYLYLYFVAS